MPTSPPKAHCSVGYPVKNCNAKGVVASEYGPSKTELECAFGGDARIRLAR